MQSVVNFIVHVALQCVSVLQMMLHISHWVGTIGSCIRKLVALSGIHPRRDDNSVIKFEKYGCRCSQ
jgi:hypothetical protein